MHRPVDGVPYPWVWPFLLLQQGNTSAWIVSREAQSWRPHLPQWQPCGWCHVVCAKLLNILHATGRKVKARVSRVNWEQGRGQWDRQGPDRVKLCRPRQELWILRTIENHWKDKKRGKMTWSEMLFERLTLLKVWNLYVMRDVCVSGQSVGEKDS